MTRRYFTIASLSFLALTMLGCGDDNKPAAKAKIDPMAMDEEDKILNDSSSSDGDYESDIELFPGESWVEAGDDYSQAAITFTNSGTYRSYGKRNGGRSAWRIPKIGRIGGRALVRFPSGKQYLVRIGKANRTSKGFVFKQGSHGGWYIHACYGDSSTTVTVYWS